MTPRQRAEAIVKPYQMGGITIEDLIDLIQFAIETAVWKAVQSDRALAAQLAAALKPFASLILDVNNRADLPYYLRDGEKVDRWLMVSDLRAASKALAAARAAGIGPKE